MFIFIIFDSDFGEKGFSNLILEEEYEWNYCRYLEDVGWRVGLFGLDLDSEMVVDVFEINVMKSVVYLFVFS